ncbi:recombinase family protein [Acidobacteria bacterium AH-259-L09]|nr:recombinase family protein [Acidobacteria bacterium AH-259-L09]
MTKRKRVAVYARVSKAMEQTNENQLLDLRRYVSDRDWQILREYCALSHDVDRQHSTS